MPNPLQHIDRMRAICLAATKGRRLVCEDKIVLDDPRRTILVYASASMSNPEMAADMAHIAAFSPDVVMALLNVARAAERLDVDSTPDSGAKYWRIRCDRLNELTSALEALGRVGGVGT